MIPDGERVYYLKIKKGNLFFSCDHDKTKVLCEDCQSEIEEKIGRLLSRLK